MCTPSHGFELFISNSRFQVKPPDLKARAPRYGPLQAQQQLLASFCASAADSLPGRPSARAQKRHRQLWEHFASGQSRLKLPHNVYLKLFQLHQKLRDKAFGCFDTLLVDEAQDCTDCMLQALTCTRVARVLACDPRQNIYQFNLVTGEQLRAMQVDHRMSLPQSFRFGQEIADFLTQIVRSSPNRAETDFTVRGMPGINTQLHLGDGPEDSINALLQSRQRFTVLARKNATLFLQAAHVLSKLRGDASIAFIGGFQAFRESQLEPVVDLFLLGQGHKHDIQSNYLNRFYSLRSFRDKCQESRDVNWLGKLATYDALSQEVGPETLGELIEQVRSACTFTSSCAV